MWLDSLFQFNKNYVSLINEKYSADLYWVDFKNLSASATQINDWVSSKTHNRINNIIDTNIIISLTAMCIINTLFFSANWETRFEKWQTCVDTFYCSNTKKKEIDFMYQREKMRYGETNDYQFISKKYALIDYSFYVVLPKEHFGINAVESHLNDVLTSITDPVYTTEDVQLWLPKFRMDCQYQLINLFRKLGIQSKCRFFRNLTVPIIIY